MVEYNFEEMNVDHDYLREVADGNLKALFFAFTWNKTPQGDVYWYKVDEGEIPLDTDLLKDMLEQYDAWVESKQELKDLFKVREETLEAGIKSEGGPSSYYDFPFHLWVTVNDSLEYLAFNVWGPYSVHFKDIFKAGFRWGRKGGTTKEYDAKKIIYSGLRLLGMVAGKEAVYTYLQELIEDKQFKPENKE